MIQLHVDKESEFYPMKPAEEIRTCNFPKEEIGIPKAAVLKGWFQYWAKTDIKYASELAKVRRQRQKELATGKNEMAGRRSTASKCVGGESSY
jgi:hypothetical protein